MRHFIYIPLVLILLVSCKQRANDITSKKTNKNTIRSLIAMLENADSNNVMVIAHRGDWRNAPENSLQAIQNCIDMGVDIVEIDIHKTKDGKLVLIHDKKLDRTTTGKGLVKDWTLDSLRTLYLRNGANHPTHHKIPTLEEAMLLAKGKILINLDKCYSYFDEAYEILKKTGTTDQVIMKGKVTLPEVRKEFGEYLDKVPFMPVVVLHEENTEETINEYIEKFSPIAFEFVFKDEKSPILSKFKEIRKKGSRIWVNSLWKSLNAGYEDDMALVKTDSIYGWYIKKGVNMIQTDRPQLLLNYLRDKGLHK
ncbi:glycerophosphodiester phosphodiesterase family protein [Polaribacter batillariae]|uniref:Glycerophosphodiester phosphodiesterase family protein n=1 Tax=Polaribacter batillariae TaxID=2808900 RepID=A0ABX7T0L0_9FLAO|nr:glycerophosphodiester phosphodiesterase family protein [Polaribacter batillariae]